MEWERRAWIEGNGNGNGNGKVTLSHRCVYKLDFICENTLERIIIRKKP